MTTPRTLGAVGALATVLVLAVAACGGDDSGDSSGGTSGAGLSGRIQADGSSTVGPFTTRAAEDFQRDNSGVQVTVGISGTGGGFERFCAGETDISDASRPIKDEERQACEAKGIEYVEFQVANDALTVVVNKENDWATCLTVDQLKAIWEPGSKVGNWSQVPDAGFPDQQMKLFGPGTDSGTFDYFTDEINGEEGASRTDYAPSEDDNIIVQGVAGEKGGLGYFGFSYFEENQGTLNAVEIDGGDGCVAPSATAAQDGSYKPLSRPLFVYVKKDSFAKPEVEAFVGFMLDNAATIAEETQYVAMTQAQIDEAKSAYDAAVAEVGAGTTGTTG
ncbi:MAG TPA: PstS family phosphate ABC transporter substrate-binding protein [Gaiellaceae bacterium]|nr:PstS family phosphate ABC transporter substrate-binding protein [Gaiellaceae bacterium]